MSPAPRRVLITGGASGIGACMAEVFAAAGDRVAVLDRDKPRPAAMPSPVECVLTADVGRPDEVRRAFTELDSVWHGVDVLCSNAGISIRSSFLDTSPDDWDRTLRTNLTGMFLVGQQAARRMLDAGGGVIVNTGSVSGLVGMPGYAAYNASKAGVIELTKTMALELAPTVRVNTICPGYVLTPMQEAEYTAQMLARQAADIPLGRLGRPREIAELALYLASAHASFVTGQSFVIDGGESAGGLASASDQSIAS